MSEDWWATNIDSSSTPITAELIEEVWRKLEDASPPGPHRHVVGPSAEGWTVCADCFAPLYVFTDARGRKRMARVDEIPRPYPWE